MFSTSVTLPNWIFLLMLVASLYAVVMSILFPGVRWYLQRRLNKAVQKLNSNLQIKIRPLQQTKRQVLKAATLIQGRGLFRCTIMRNYQLPTTGALMLSDSQSLKSKGEV